MEATHDALARFALCYRPIVTPQGRSSGNTATSGATNVIARARIRFEIDYGYPQAYTQRAGCTADPTGGPSCPPVPIGSTPSPAVCNDANGDGDSVDPGDCTASTIRARVPKVVYWSIKG